LSDTRRRNSLRIGTAVPLDGTIAASSCYRPQHQQTINPAHHGNVRVYKFAVMARAAPRCSTHIGEVRIPTGLLTMTKSIPTIAAALLLTAIASPVFAQAAVQEPGLAAFNHPNVDVLNAGRGGYRSFDSANAYYNEAPAPRTKQRSAQPRHHRAAR
jgi:hypothetical protein